MPPKYTITEILDALAAQRQQGETSLVVTLDPSLIPDAMTALRGYRKMFAPVVPGLTDTSPIYAAYEQMRHDEPARHTLLLLVECETTQRFREALDQLPVRTSAEWRSCNSRAPKS